MIYRFINRKQEKFLKELSEALGIGYDCLLDIQYIQELKEITEANKLEIERLKTSLEQRDNTILELTKLVADLQQDVLNMQNEEMLRDLHG